LAHREAEQAQAAAEERAGVDPAKLHTISEFLVNQAAWTEIEDRREIAREKREEQRLLSGELEAADPKWAAEADKVRRRREAEQAAKLREEAEATTPVTQADLKREKQTLLGMAKGYAKMFTGK
jgi:hypothetical protein